jgi:hypothetical protein
LRQHHLSGAAQHLDNGHWRYVGACAPRAGQLAVSDDRQLPAALAVGCRGDQFGH